MFKLEFDIPKSSEKITLSDSICLMGSCFSDEIGALLTENKIDNLSNPFGTIYNPHSIFKLLADQVESNNIIQSQEVFYHWDAHGIVSGLTEEDTQTLFEHKRNDLKSYLTKTHWLVITLGTAFVYEYQEEGIVANCHKVSTSSFEKRLLKQSEIINQFAELHSYLDGINPELNILFTISPVRHIRDGLIENNRSKAILLDAVHLIKKNYANVGYFPSYEILIDELRDYRFFQKDMIHPSEAAVIYIWERFSQTYFDRETQEILTEWKKIKTAINHRPFQPQSISHQSFLKNTFEKLQKMNEKIDVSVELEELKKQIQ
ncbi:GSCFA domain-containing protein [Ekhidna sp. To15]|uniref:GSCFA domain-containing protein n=1 Tax=Ekhidna sp. To15 TaxID=3395267 RepID=UPI003F51E77B